MLPAFIEELRIETYKAVTPYSGLARGVSVPRPFWSCWLCGPSDRRPLYKTTRSVPASKAGQAAFSIWLATICAASSSDGLPGFVGSVSLSDSLRVASRGNGNAVSAAGRGSP